MPASFHAIPQSPTAVENTVMPTGSIMPVCADSFE
jgi:hypothetical protein